jgi:hypothetical protein
MEDVYFATLAAEEIGEKLLEKIDNYTTEIEANGTFDRLLSSYNAYYNIDESGHHYAGIVRDGRKGEIHKLKVNDFRNIIQHLLVMIISNRPALEARAINSDYKSLTQARLANGVVEYYMREKKLERFLKGATELSLISGEGYIHMEWDAQRGEAYGTTDSGAVIYEGDIKFENYSPLEVIVDPYRKDTHHSYYIVKKLVNKYDLVARYEEHEEVILNTKEEQRHRLSLGPITINKETDDVPMYIFYHKKTDSLPNGRMLYMLDDGTVLFDGPLPYKEIPLYRITPAEFINTPNGYSPAFDLIGIQDGLNRLYSTVLTNHSTFGIQNIITDKGSDLSVNQLKGGLNLIQKNAGTEVKALNLTETPAEIFKFTQMLEQKAETISAVNSVVRGNPEASLKSGAALALVASTALTFNSGLQQSYAQLLEDVGTAMVNILKEFAVVPRMAAIVGTNNQSALKEFIGEDLSNINRVVVSAGNALSKTTSGKIEIANNLLQNKMFDTPEEYLNVLTTGSLEPMYESKQSEILLIRKENESMREGEQVRSISLDSHALHIREHKTILSDLAVRENEEVVQIVLNHIREHITLLKQTDPVELQMTGQEPLQQQQNQQELQEKMMQMGQGPQKPGPTPKPSLSAQPPEGGKPMDEQIQERMPEMPTNPLTKQKFVPPTQ